MLLQNNSFVDMVEDGNSRNLLFQNKVGCNNEPR